MKKQNGIVNMVSLLIVVGLVSVIILEVIPIWQRYQHVREARGIKEQVEFVWNAVKQYQADRYSLGVNLNDISSLPVDIDAMMPNYITSCTVASNDAGQCSRPDTLPWNSRIQYSREFVTITANGQTISVPGSVITIPMANLTPQRVKNIALSVLGELPNSQYDAATDTVTARFGRIGAEVEHQALVARDGTTPLTGENWDVGGVTAIWNIKGLFLRNGDGSQTAVASGLSKTVVATHGQSFPVHSCPIGYTPDLVLNPKSIQPFSSSTRFGALGPYNVRHTISGGRFYVYLDYWAQTSPSQPWVQRHDGLINVSFVCV